MIDYLFISYYTDANGIGEIPGSGPNYCVHIWESTLITDRVNESRARLTQAEMACPPLGWLILRNWIAFIR